MDDVEPQVAARRERFSQVLDALEKQGLSQREIAMRACVPPQYFSDVKLGRRSLSELFARRLGEEFDVDHIWLMTGSACARAAFSFLISCSNSASRFFCALFAASKRRIFSWSRSWSDTGCALSIHITSSIQPAKNS